MVASAVPRAMSLVPASTIIAATQRADHAVANPALAAGQPGEVLLRIQRIGVCGSDVHVYHGKHPYTKYPVVQGHEYSASVEAVGPGVIGLALGTKVTSMPQIVCGECAPCKRGDYHICDKLKVMGFQTTGAASELFAVDASKSDLAPR